MDRQKRQSHRDRRRSSGCQVPKGGSGGEGLLNASGVSVWGDENILELDSGDDCTTL